MVEFDRKQELTRLRKKADDFKRRAERGTRMLGDDEELRDLLIGAGDLEKKTAKERAIFVSVFSAANYMNLAGAAKFTQLRQL